MRRSISWKILAILTQKWSQAILKAVHSWHIWQVLQTRHWKDKTEIHQIRYDNYSEEVVWHIVPSVTESLSLGEPSPRVPTDSRIKMQYKQIMIKHTLEKQVILVIGNYFGFSQILPPGDNIYN